jgi:hypothetical protein
MNNKIKTLETENFEVDIEINETGLLQYAAFEGTSLKELAKEANDAGFVFAHQSLKRKTGERILIVSKPAVVH